MAFTYTLLHTNRTTEELGYHEELLQNRRRLAVSISCTSQP